MVIHIQCGKNNLLTTLRDSKVQSVPFKIHADCDAKVAQYFESSLKEDEDKILSTSFRGYPLKGKKIELPQGYVGIVLHESISPITENKDRKLHIIHDFKTLTYWNWDKKPSANDKLIQALDWIDIAEALHSPIVEE